MLRQSQMPPKTSSPTSLPLRYSTTTTSMATSQSTSMVMVTSLTHMDMVSQIRSSRQVTASHTRRPIPTNRLTRMPDTLLIHLLNLSMSHPRRLTNHTSPLITTTSQYTSLSLLLTSTPSQNCLCLRPHPQVTTDSLATRTVTLPTASSPPRKMKRLRSTCPTRSLLSRNIIAQAMGTSLTTGTMSQSPITTGIMSTSMATIITNPNLMMIPTMNTTPGTIATSAPISPTVQSRRTSTSPLMTTTLGTSTSTALTSEMNHVMKATTTPDSAITRAISEFTIASAQAATEITTQTIMLSMATTRQTIIATLPSMATTALTLRITTRTLLPLMTCTTTTT